MFDSEIWNAWNWNPLLGLSLAIVGWRYMDVVWRLRRQSRVNVVPQWRIASFWSGMLALFIALISPLDALSEELLSAHMVQHLLLMMVAAPLLCVGLTPLVLAWFLPRRSRPGLARWFNRRWRLMGVWRLVTNHAFTWMFFALVLWLWHVPGAYQAALRDETVHLLEHATFFGASVVFWSTLLLPGRDGLSPGKTVLAIFTSALHSSVLGALMTFSSSLWYPDYALLTSAWGLTPLEDQQLAGVVMWVIGGVIYLLVLLVVLYRWLAHMEHGNKAAANQRNIRRRVSG